MEVDVVEPEVPSVARDERIRYLNEALARLEWKKVGCLGGGESEGRYCIRVTAVALDAHICHVSERRQCDGAVAQIAQTGETRLGCNIVDNQQLCSRCRARHARSQPRRMDL